MKNFIRQAEETLNRFGKYISELFFGKQPETIKTVFFLPDTDVTIDVETATKEDIKILQKFFIKFKHAQNIQNRTYRDNTAGEYRETLKNKEDFNAVNELFRIHFPHYCI